ncbi:hypothetical protein [Komagataeibacter sp. FNDCF1]|uniref:hypothetical protein n=1 Tax=Komagataeibacter sp. FNDCF1 TaxID=2878681 RepID=UPI001E51594F|nr:hypothetical protein [Komagataeibacter sp. FNDCF1]MCE2564975.1 hypothetical protein [Komagataeibacter sp. FNDCF1]
MPSIRTLLAGLGLAALAGTGAQARSHHFSVPMHRSHANSPYGHVRNYEATMDEKDPRYVAAEQKCEAKGAMGALTSANGGSAQISAGGSHVQFFSQCMVEMGAWQNRYNSNVGGNLNQ